MKKFYFWYLLTLIIVALLPQAADAQQNRTQRESTTHVTAAQAMDIGYAFMHTGSGSKSGGTQSNAVRKQTMQLVYTGRATDSLTRAVTDCYYVFALQPKGFVIVAADDRVEPILGYSYDNDFVVENMPAHVRSWLGAYEKQIEAVAKSDQEADPAAKDKWMALKLGQPMNSAKNGTTVGPLLTTTWNQGQYYNNLCPADAYGPAGHVYTGCVATAMAQIIHYWGYPTQGRGIHSYESNYGMLTVNYGSTNYDYTLMPDALTSASTSQEVEAVSTLIRDCGVAVNMGYSPMESSSFDQDARAAFINFFRYSPNLSFAEKVYFSDSEWDAMLHADLDNNRPIYYSGQGSGGHAFVCDGYDANGYYHFNFGWGGFADGWFLTSSVTPGSSNFSSSQAALFGIVPDSTGHVILGQTEGTSTFIVDEPLEFYHLMGHNTYEGGNYYNSCNNTVNFIPANSTNQIVADILDYEDQTLTFSDGNGNQLRSLVGGNDNDYSPVVSSYNSLNISYSGNMYYAGFKLNISQTDNNGCRMVSNITSFVEAQTVHLTWTENGMATQWEIEYGVKGFSLGTGTIYTADTNIATFSNLQELTEYDFYIRSICGGNHYGQWNKTTVMIDGRYWQDVVTSQPAGYVIDTVTNSVQISTAEELTWWAKTGNGIDGHLATDIDLSGYKWQPTELSNRNFNGHGHSITNMFVLQGNGFFLESAAGSVIENVGLTDAVIKSYSSVGGLCGELGGTMRNCYVSNSVIEGGYYAGGLVEMNSGTIVNCYVNAGVIGSQVGLLTCNTNGIIRNCYAAGNLTIRSWCYNAGIAAVVQEGEISYCYSVDEGLGVVGTIIGTASLTNLSTFARSGNNWLMSTPVAFDDVTETDLFSALNRGVAMYNDSVYNTWTNDVGNVNGGYPIFGDKHIVQCPNVTDVSVQNVKENGNYIVTVSWTENGDASQWRIRYRRHDRPDTVYTVVTTTNNPCTIYGIPMGYEYDFSVRAVCDANNQSGWSETKTEIIDLPFWTDVVTSQPTGYVEDANGNVEIYSAEGLAWLAVVTNGFHNQEANSFVGKTVKLNSDINIEGYRWYPIGNNLKFEDIPWNAGYYVGGFSGTFEGQNHKISNIYMNDDAGSLFGAVFMGRIKNVILDGGHVICNGGGGLISYALDCYEISNCHSSAKVYSKGRVGDYYNSGYAGSLCGKVENLIPDNIPWYQEHYGGGVFKTIVSNCSSTGTVYGGNTCGNLIGRIYGNVEVRNCYATGNVKLAAEFSYGSWRGGLIGNLFHYPGAYNCFSIGNVEGGFAKVIGSSFNTHTHYIYGQDDVNEELELIDNYSVDIADTSQFHHDGNTNALLTPVSIGGVHYFDLLDALNAWVIAQNDSTLRTWVLDTLTGYPVFGDFFVPSCLSPTDLIVSQATVIGDTTIKTRLAWTDIDEVDHWDVLYVAPGQSITSGDVGTIIPVNSNPCVLAGIPVGQPLDFYVRAVCGEDDYSGWCGPVTYIPDKLHWTEVVTSQPEGFQLDANHNVYISSAEGLSWLSSVVNELNGAHGMILNHIVLTKDIDLSAYRWTSIGDGRKALFFTFDGNNHVVYGLYCTELSPYQGLFGEGYCGEIRNLTLTNCYVYGTFYSGALVGRSWANIVNCSVKGHVSGGGLVGEKYGGNIENSYFIGTAGVDGICEDSHYGEINNCYAVNEFNGFVSRKYYGATNSDFSENANIWMLNTPLYIDGEFHGDLLGALDAWVDANNTVDGRYYHWVADTAMVNGGYPIFESVSIPAVTTHDTVVAQGYYCWHGMVFTSDTVVADTLYTYNGYDSVVTYHILVNPATITEIMVDTCSSYIWNGQTYSKTGDYVQTFSTAVNDADSVAILHLTINRLYGVDVQHVCGNSYTWIDGVTYIADNNTSKYLVTTEGGCDSLVSLYLTFGHNTSSDTSAVACNSFDWYEQTNLTQSGDYIRTLTNASGCDSVVTLHLTINQSTVGIDELTACDSLVWIDGITYTESNNTATYTLTNAAGCDSVVTLHLTVNYSNIGDTTVVACDNFDWYEQTNLTQSGDYTRILTNANGCDSVVTLHLTINHSTSSDTTAVACNSFDWYEQTNLTQSGDYTRTLTNASGCDSVITLHLTINQPTTGTDVHTACGSFTWIDGVTYTESNDTATYTLSNAESCDSVVTLNLTINQPTTGIDVQTACGSFTWVDGVTYTESNSTATYTLSNAVGCDSIVTLHLTINTATEGDTIATVCESFDWYGMQLTQSGDYTHTLTNAAGCDSTVTLHLTVNTPTVGDTTATVCGSFSWYEYSDLTQSGNYTHMLTNAAGCDSIVTLHLTVNQPVTTTCSATICDSELPYVWNGLTFNEAGTQSQTLQTVNGCDSVVTMTLTVNQSATGIDEQEACDSFEWIDGVTYTTSTDLPTYTIESGAATGCDSIVTLHLTINQSASSEFTIVTNESCYVWNGIEYCETGDYTQTLQTADGCDSVVTLHLTIETSISDHSLNANMKVYPNPTSDIVKVELTINNGQSGDVAIQLYDMYGKLLDMVNVGNTDAMNRVPTGHSMDSYDAANAHGATAQTTQIDLSRYANGVYFIKAVAEGNVLAVRKVVKN